MFKASDFNSWLVGYLTALTRVPATSEWRHIRDHIMLLPAEDPTIIWMQGFMEMSPGRPTRAQWTKIREKLNELVEFPTEAVAGDGDGEEDSEAA